MDNPKKYKNGRDTSDCYGLPEANTSTLLFQTCKKRYINYVADLYLLWMFYRVLLGIASGSFLDFASSRSLIHGISDFSTFKQVRYGTGY